MVKTKGPCMSLSASGTLADAISFRTLSGKSICSKRPVPTDRRSDKQLGRRSWFRLLCSCWADLDSSEKQSWIDNCPDRFSTPWHFFLSINLDELLGNRYPSAVYPITRLVVPDSVSYSSKTISGLTVNFVLRRTTFSNLFCVPVLIRHDTIAAKAIDMRSFFCPFPSQEYTTFQWTFPESGAWKVWWLSISRDGKTGTIASSSFTL